jgi:hypothetical protein
MKIESELSKFPQEILVLIFDLLSYKDLASVNLVSKWFREATNLVWRLQAEKNFPHFKERDIKNVVEYKDELKIKFYESKSLLDQTLSAIATLKNTNTYLSNPFSSWKSNIKNKLYDAILKDDLSTVLKLLDSKIACLLPPYLNDTAPIYDKNFRANWRLMLQKLSTYDPDFRMCDFAIIPTLLPIFRLANAINCYKISLCLCFLVRAQIVPSAYFKCKADFISKHYLSCSEISKMISTEFQLLDPVASGYEVVYDHQIEKANLFAPEIVIGCALPLMDDISKSKSTFIASLIEVYSNFLHDTHNDKERLLAFILLCKKLSIEGVQLALNDNYFVQKIILEIAHRKNNKALNELLLEGLNWDGSIMRIFSKFFDEYNYYKIIESMPDKLRKTADMMEFFLKNENNSVEELNSLTAIFEENVLGHYQHLQTIYARVNNTQNEEDSDDEIVSSHNYDF